MAEIQSDDWSRTIVADEGWAGISEAGLDPFQAECLRSAALVKFHEMGCKANARYLRVTQADVGRGIGFVVAGDFQIIDIDMGQAFGERALFSAAR